VLLVIPALTAISASRISSTKRNTKTARCFFEKRFTMPQTVRKSSRAINMDSGERCRKALWFSIVFGSTAEALAIFQNRKRADRV